MQKSRISGIYLGAEGDNNYPHLFFFLQFQKCASILDIVVIVIQAKQFIFLLHFCTHYFLKLGPGFLNKKLLFHELILTKNIKMLQLTFV